MPQLNSLAKVSSEEQRSGIIRMPGYIIMMLSVIWEAEKILVFRDGVFYVRTEPGNLGAWPTKAVGRELSSTILVLCVFICLEERKDDL